MVGRAIIRDLFDRDRAASMIGLVATVMVVAPTLGPLIGGLLDTALRLGIDLHLHRASRSAAVVIWAALALPETAACNAPPARGAGFLRDLASCSREPRSSSAMCWSRAFGSATFFAFLGGGPHVVVT